MCGLMGRISNKMPNDHSTLQLPTIITKVFSKFYET
jgi:hypothetical protein